jgi:hypothetical protein
MNLAELERQLAAHAGARDRQGVVGPVFVLGAPRTGSTFFYQNLVAGFRLPFFANLTDWYFPRAPIIGLSIQAAWPMHGAISGASRYGKVPGLLQPSEASGVMAHWFGGGHPSELVSRDILPGREADLYATIGAAWQLYRRPLVIKNAWNCFRIAYLAQALPSAIFIWIRRDITASARSDLEARYAIYGNPNCWNSATPRNWPELRCFPYWAQVVENQAEFSRAIGTAAAAVDGWRFAEVWYEDFIATPAAVLDRLSLQLPALAAVSAALLPPICRGVGTNRLPDADRERIDAYVDQHAPRLAGLRRPPGDNLQ